MEKLALFCKKCNQSFSITETHCKINFPNTRLGWIPRIEFRMTCPTCKTGQKISFGLPKFFIIFGNNGKK
ncbi:MAG: hypothetical protein US66_C0017G0005 [Candidatus Moranbacteria bacterium GW2011_GWD2_37_9]|nr:MAG: hypothetical protein US44_C0009G0001 [Candidatus Moranbacteria bacterium GW2011_GWD1_37_17]KKQ47175.1 MAG: hypothetical protein US66_C0017G0005 [Candidatus Moranbacteria bacterium GW2011_GWD2_37_9]HBO16730.1 hypothetical protein [Candidatus Moranbacteria bacterium]